MISTRRQYPEGVEIDLKEAGRKEPRLLRFDWSSIARWEEETGRSILGLFNGGIGVGSLSSLIAHGLKHQEPKLSTSRVEAICQRYCDRGGEIPDLIATVTEALTDSGLFGDPSGGAAEGEEGEEPGNE